MTNDFSNMVTWRYAVALEVAFVLFVDSPTCSKVLVSSWCALSPRQILQISPRCTGYISSHYSTCRLQLCINFMVSHSRPLLSSHKVVCTVITVTLLGDAIWVRFFWLTSGLRAPLYVHRDVISIHTVIIIPHTCQDICKMWLVVVLSTWLVCRCGFHGPLPSQVSALPVPYQLQVPCLVLINYFNNKRFPYLVCLCVLILHSFHIQ